MLKERLFILLHSKITVFGRPDSFIDDRIEGIFKSLKHQHVFDVENQNTLIVDFFELKSPFSILGKLANGIFLEQYPCAFLKERNETIRAYPESKKGQYLLQTPIS